MSNAAGASDTIYVPGWTFADKIRKARQSVGMDQREFAQAIDITSSSLASYETGRSTPRFRAATDLAKRIQMLTRIDYKWFLDFESPRQDSNLRQTDYKVGAGELIYADFTRGRLEVSA